MVARATPSLPEGPDWLYEVKLDGYRALVLKHGGHVQVRSRNNKDLTRRYPDVAAAAARMREASVVLDGEVVAVDAAGFPSFQALQDPAAHPSHAVVFYAFDVLYLDGEDLRPLPLVQRTGRLSAIVRESGLLVSQPLTGSAAQVVEAVRRLGLEGVIAKRRDSRYESGTRSDAWLKFRLDRQQEFVIGGYRPGGHGVDALVVGYYEGRQLRFAAKVQAGLTPHTRRDLAERLRPWHTGRCPFTELPTRTSGRFGGGIPANDMAEMQWVRPRLVAQLRFVEWTNEGHLRHAAFLGLREDKATRAVVREP